MKPLLIGGSVVALGLTIVPSILVAMGLARWETHAHLMAAGMILWFITAPFWMKRD
jgi:hypothetical protein